MSGAEGCAHEVVMKDLCAMCGKDLRRKFGLPGERVSKADASVAVVHNIPELLVSKGAAEKIGSADQEYLLKSRKLALLVDLDQTLIHTTTDVPNVNLSEVYYFDDVYQRQRYYVKLRPNTRNFLTALAKYYELHICTFGVRWYAHKVANILDPGKQLFGHRILSRDECFDPYTKTANLRALFPCGDNFVCIIDDREDVWHHAPNLIKVEPYRFWKNVGDINAPPGAKDAKPEKGHDAVEKPEDKEQPAFLELPKEEEPVQQDILEHENLEDYLLPAAEANNQQAEGSTEDLDSEPKDSPTREVDLPLEISTDLKPTTEESSSSSSSNNSTADLADQRNQGSHRASDPHRSEDSHSHIRSGSDQSVPMDSSLTGDALESNNDRLIDKIAQNRSVDFDVDDASITGLSIKSAASSSEKEDLDSTGQSSSKIDLPEVSTVENESSKNRPKIDLPEAPTDGIKLDENPVPNMAASVVEIKLDQNPVSNIDAPAVEKKLDENPVPYFEASTVELKLDESPVPNIEASAVNESVHGVEPSTSAVEEERGGLSKSPKIDRSNKSPKTDRSTSELDRSMKSPEIHRSPKFSIIDRSSESPNIDRSTKSPNIDRSSKSPKIDRSKRAPGDQAKRTGVEDNDQYLFKLEKILRRVHGAFYQLYDKMQARSGDGCDERPDLKLVIPYVRRKVLHGVRLAFTAVIPRNHDITTSYLAVAARAYGATIQDELMPKPDDPSTWATHLVAGKWGTHKVHEAKKARTIWVVKPEWLHACFTNWDRVREKRYLVARSDKKDRRTGSVPEDDSTNTRSSLESCRIEEHIKADSIENLMLECKEAQELTKAASGHKHRRRSRRAPRPDVSRAEAQELTKAASGHKHRRRSRRAPRPDVSPGGTLATLRPDEIDDMTKEIDEIMDEEDTNDGIDDSGENREDGNSDSDAEPPLKRSRELTEGRESSEEKSVVDYGEKSTMDYDDDVESIGSVDDEMAEALEREFGL